MSIITSVPEVQPAFQFDDPRDRIEEVRNAILSLDSAIYDLSKALAELDDRDVPEAVSDLARSLHHDVEDLRWEFDSHDFLDQVKELAEQAGENDAAEHV